MKKSTGKKVLAVAKEIAGKVKKAATAKKTVKHLVEEQPKKTRVKVSTKKVAEPVKAKPTPVTKTVVKESAPQATAEKPAVATSAPRTAIAQKTVRHATASAIKGMHGVGRRKSAIARVWLTRGTGALLINERAYDQYFDTLESKLSVTAPFRVVSYAKQYDVHVNVHGGGQPAQADAVKLGLSRALLAGDESLRPLLRKAGLLTVDSRVKERKKYGRKAARRRFQFVKR